MTSTTLTATQAGRRQRGFVPALDGVRGIAILMVLCHNFNAISHPRTTAEKLYELAMGSGWLGVQLFFVLSGFLITGILIESRRARNYYRAFIGRRALRIFPLYYAALAVTFGLVPLVTGSGVGGHEHQLWMWTYVSNWVQPFGLAVVPLTHCWSLAIEEQFYLVWPFVVRRLSLRQLLTACAALMVVSLGARVAVLLTLDAGAAAAYMFTVCRMDALAAGAAAAILIRVPRVATGYHHRRAMMRWATLVAMLVTVALTRGAARTGVFTQTVGYTLFGLGGAVLVFDMAVRANAGDWTTRVFSFAPLRMTGKYSYAMYVFHLPLHLFVGMPLLARAGSGTTVGIPVALAYLVAATVATLVAAILSYHVLEKHFLRLKTRLVPRVTTTTA